MLYTNIKSAFERYADIEKGLEPKSIKTITSHMEQLMVHVGDEEISNYNTEIIREYLQYRAKNPIPPRKKPWSPKTFRNHRQSLSSFFEWAISSKSCRLKENPVESIEKPKLDKRQPRNISKTDACRIIASVQFIDWKYAFDQDRNEALVCMFTYTGLRRQELIDLRIEDVDFRENLIRVRRGKGGKERYVPMIHALKSVLLSYVQARKDQGIQSQYFFCGTWSQNKICEKTIRRMFKKISEYNDVKVTPHMLRHTFGTTAIESGMSLYNVQRTMGHSNISTTEIYLNTSLENRKEDMEKFSLTK